MLFYYHFCFTNFYKNPKKVLEYLFSTIHCIMYQIFYTLFYFLNFYFGCCCIVYSYQPGAEIFYMKKDFLIWVDKIEEINYEKSFKDLMPEERKELVAKFMAKTANAPVDARFDATHRAKFNALKNSYPEGFGKFYPITQREFISGVLPSIKDAYEKYRICERFYLFFIS